MPTPDNIDFFNLFTLALFDRLYSEFPIPIDMDVKQFATGLLPEDIELEVGFKRLLSADHAVIFLTDEGFITHKGTYLEGGTFLQIRLTSKGLSALGSTPDTLEGREPLISRIRKVLAGGTKEAGAETVKLLVQQAFNAVVTAAPAIAANLIR